MYCICNLYDVKWFYMISDISSPFNQWVFLCFNFCNALLGRRYCASSASTCSSCSNSWLRPKPLRGCRRRVSMMGRCGGMDYFLENTAESMGENYMGKEGYIPTQNIFFSRRCVFFFSWMILRIWIAPLNQLDNNSDYGKMGDQWEWDIFLGGKRNPMPYGGSGLGKSSNQKDWYVRFNIIKILFEY